jgi:hypothetical protein
MRWALLGMVMAVAASGAEAQTLSARQGQALVIQTHGQFNRDCAPAGLPTLMSSNASGGTVSTRRGTYAITSSAVGFGQVGNCAGRSVPGTTVVYTPRRGFTGTDTVTYTLQFGATPRQFSRTVTVR